MTNEITKKTIKSNIKNNQLHFYRDDFVANSKFGFDELKLKTVNDIWLDLEPHGRLHLIIELKGSFAEG